VTHQRTEEVDSLYAADVILFEGILSFAEEGVRDLMDLKIFVDTDDDTRLIRRIRRDLASRGRTLESILDQYEKFVKPSFDVHIAPTKKFADVVIPRGETNVVAIDLVVQHIKHELSRQAPGKKR
jgi:uridine kinase